MAKKQIVVGIPFNLISFPTFNDIRNMTDVQKYQYALETEECVIFDDINSYFQNLNDNLIDTESTLWFPLKLEDNKPSTTKESFTTRYDKCVERIDTAEKAMRSLGNEIINAVKEKLNTEGIREVEFDKSGHYIFNDYMEITSIYLNDNDALEYEDKSGWCDDIIWLNNNDYFAVIRILIDWLNK